MASLLDRSTRFQMGQDRSQEDRLPLEKQAQRPAASGTIGLSPSATRAAQVRLTPVSITVPVKGSVISEYMGSVRRTCQMDN